ncbi:type VII secretion protein EssB/YukC [Virgibacillus oceani]
MEDSHVLKHGYIKEENESIIYQIQKEQTRLVDKEQLYELKKDDPLFFKFQNCKVDDTYVRVSYEKLQGYKSIQHFLEADQEVKRQIAINLLSVEKMIGTQYTTLIHPTNIYADDIGNVMLAHRGIRSVFPTEELTVPQLLSELKKIIIYLFSSYSLSQINSTKKKNILRENSFLEKIHQADSIEHLNRVLHSEPIPEQKQGKEIPKKPLLSGILIGVLAGMLLLYMFKVVPMSEAADNQMNQEAELSHENLELIDEKEELQASLENRDLMIRAYEAAINGDTEEAISTFEGVENLHENAEMILLEQYLNSDTPESLEKAANLGEDYPLRVVEGLTGLNSSDANEAILTIASDIPEVSIEKAWINEEYESVIEVYDDNQENERAKYLAAHSYIELENHEAALDLGQELEDNDIQIASLILQQEEIADDDDLDDDERDDLIEELDEMIDDLE